MGSVEVFIAGFIAGFLVLFIWAWVAAIRSGIMDKVTSGPEKKRDKKKETPILPDEEPTYEYKLK